MTLASGNAATDVNVYDADSLDNRIDFHSNFDQQIFRSICMLFPAKTGFLHYSFILKLSKKNVNMSLTSTLCSSHFSISPSLMRSQVQVDSRQQVYLFFFHLVAASTCGLSYKGFASSPGFFFGCVVVISCTVLVDLVFFSVKTNQPTIHHYHL